MKAYGHTKTLFIQAGKYKWSYRHDHCINCGKVDKPHKGRGLCTSCWDKERMETPRRQEVRKNASRKFCEKKRIPVEFHKKKKPIYTQEELKERRKEAYRKWYGEWKEAILLLRFGARMKKQGIPLPEYKCKPIPFNIGPREKEESYEDYKERIRKFDHIKAYIDSRKIP